MTGKILLHKEFQKELEISEKSHFYKTTKLIHNENIETFLYNNFQKQFAIVAISNTKLFSKAVSKAFKLVFHQMQRFHTL